MKEEIEVLEKIANELARLNKNIEESIEMAKEASKPVEIEQLPVLEQAKRWFESVLNQMVIDIARDFSVKVSTVDKDSVEYTKLLLRALKEVRAVLKLKETFEQFFTEDGLDDAIKALEKQIEDAEKSSKEKSDEAVLEIKDKYKEVAQELVDRYKEEEEKDGGN